MSTPQQYIEDIKNRQLKSDEDVLDSLAGAIDRLQKAFPRYGSFLMEFVQNADDAKSSSLKIEIIEDTVRISNNGNSFLEKDVKSICKAGRSSKTPENYIGYLGVGFKSVFLISERPEIYSGDFHFKFDKNHWKDSDQKPWQVMPLWIDNPQVNISEKYKTIFNLPLKEEKLLEKIHSEVKPDHLNNRILLFLNNIEETEIIIYSKQDPKQNFKRRIIKSKDSKTSGYEIYQIKEYKNDILEKHRWVIFRSSCITPQEVKDDYVTREWEREHVCTREIVVAFKIDEENNLMQEEKGTAHMGVFSFLPLKEILSGLNFLIQADFLTTPGRGELARECLWNDWLVDEIYKLIIEEAIPSFLKNERWKMNFTTTLDSYEGGHELFESHIKKPLRNFINNNAVLIATDGSAIRPDGAVIIVSYAKELTSESSLKQLYPDKKILAADCKIPRSIKQIVEKGSTFSEDSGIDYEMARLIKLEAEQKNLSFFKKFYSKLSKYAESISRQNDLRYQNILLTDDYGLACPKDKDAFINTGTISIPMEARDSLKFIHPELSADKTILGFLKALGVEEVTTEHIQDILKKREMPAIRKNWPQFLDNKKVEYIKSFKTSWENRQILIGDLKFLTLRTKSGKWLNPEEIIFSKEYNPEHNIEQLIDKELYDLPIELVSTEFIKDDDDDKINKWRKFFEELGVDKKVEQERNSIVQRIGTKVAMQFEKVNRREARELNESEKPGYDIESEERYIEVKSSSTPKPDISITANELKTLREKRNEYFIYVVKDALKYPILCVTIGDKLLNIDDIKMTIPFDKWYSKAKDEEFHIF